MANSEANCGRVKFGFRYGFDNDIWLFNFSAYCFASKSLSFDTKFLACILELSPETIITSDEKITFCLNPKYPIRITKTDNDRNRPSVQKTIENI